LFPRGLIVIQTDIQTDIHASGLIAAMPATMQKVATVAVLDATDR
jgi:hypothetical protein